MTNPTMLLLAMLTLLATHSGAIIFPSHIASHMVIQRNTSYSLWGVDAPLSKIAVSGAPSTPTFSIIADSSGRFEAKFQAEPANAAPSNITFTSSSGTVAVLEDILFGDVFVSSGQSNMELPVSWCYNYTQTVSSSSQYGATLRIAQVAGLASYYNVSEPQTNLTMNIPWSRSGPDNIAAMSAISYFTALEQVKANPDVPIGAIATSWGGTAMEPWMPTDALQTCGEAGKTASVPTVRADPGLYSPGRHPERELVDGPPSMHSTLWNSMVAPLLTLPVATFYWYQGESNAAAPEPFIKCFPAMIESWREHWNEASNSSLTPDIPFVFFQLAPWPALNTGMIANMRFAQLAALNLTNVGMVVTADRGDTAGAFHPIHPPVKAELSRRAAIVTANILYGNSDMPVRGPQPVKAVFHPWDASWGDYHEGTGSGSYVCHAGSGFLCGGIEVFFDQALSIAGCDGSTKFDGGADEPGDLNSFDNGFLLRDKISGSNFQRVMMTGVRPGSPSLQLNVTWVWGESPPTVLEYAIADYPVMRLYNKLGLPTMPFIIDISPEQE